MRTEKLSIPSNLKIIFIALSIVLLSLSTIFAGKADHEDNPASLQNVRQALLNSAKENDPDLSSTNSGVALTHFSHVCELMTDDGDIIYVADRRAVLLGMAAPRGLNYITFFKQDFTYLGKFRYVSARPLRCRGSKLYLADSLSESNIPGENNVIDLSRGFQDARFTYEEPYEDLR